MITYEIILEYLSPPINTFSNQNNIILPSSKFTYFKNYFDDSFYRCGIQYIHNSKNVSFENSIKYCLDTQEELSKNCQLVYDDNSISSINNLWNITKSIHNNIIVFDFKNNKISSAYYGEYFNPWRPTILLANYNEWWEPIISNEAKIFSFSSNKSSILKTKILSNEIKKYGEDNNIIINDNFNEIIELEQFVNNNEETFVNNTTFTKNKLEKMKKEELLQIISNMNITIEIIKPTKKDIIKIICKE